LGEVEGGLKQMVGGRMDGREMGAVYVRSRFFLFTCQYAWQMISLRYYQAGSICRPRLNLCGAVSAKNEYERASQHQDGYEACMHIKEYDR
jgi:hypothetical protein